MSARAFTVVHSAGPLAAARVTERLERTGAGEQVRSTVTRLGHPPIVSTFEGLEEVLSSSCALWCVALMGTPPGAALVSDLSCGGVSVCARAGESAGAFARRAAPRAHSAPHAHG